MIFRSALPDVEIPERPLTHVLLDSAARRPDKPAFIEGPTGRVMTYGEWAAAVKRGAHGLAARGFKKGEVFAIYSPNCPQYAVAFHAVALAGGVTTTINPTYTVEELDNQLRDCRARFLLTVPAFLEKAKEAARRAGVEEIFVFGEAEGATPFAALLEKDGPPPDVAIDPREDLVVLPYSSGTTGLPKGVMLTHENLVCNHTQYVDALRLGPEDCYVVYMPLSHIYGIALMGASIMSGAKQIILERFDLAEVLRLIETHGVTWLFTVPPVLLTLANTPGLSTSQFRTVRFAFSAGAPLAPEVARRVEARLGLRVIQGYGLTEASPATHSSPLEADRRKLESGGVPVAATEHRIVDLETGTRDLPPDNVGEIVVRGPQVMQGYWNAPEETARALREGWLYTGDVGWLDEEGYVYICDRKKEMIKYKGFSIAPAELESVLLEHADVEDCGVTGVEDPEAGELPKAFIVPRAGREIDFDALARFVAERVAGYKQIRQFELVDAIPRNPSGKILRRLLSR
jgi:acyl-CoA synthetase (AMP-forming)/AMP-acid ligase II